MVLVVQKCNCKFILCFSFSYFWQRQAVTMCHLHPCAGYMGHTESMYVTCGKMCCFSSAFPFWRANDARSVSRNTMCSAHAASCHGSVCSMPAERRIKKGIHNHMGCLHFLASSWLFRCSGQPESCSRDRNAVCSADNVKSISCLVCAENKEGKWP